MRAAFLSLGLLSKTCPADLDAAGKERCRSSLLTGKVLRLRFASAPHGAVSVAGCATALRAIVDTPIRRSRASAISRHAAPVDADEVVATAIMSLRMRPSKASCENGGSPAYPCTHRLSELQCSLPSWVGAAG